MRVPLQTADCDEYPGAPVVDVGSHEDEPVENVQTNSLARALLPARSLAAVVILAVYVDVPASTLVGLNVAVVPASVTVPGTALPNESERVNAALLIVAGSINSLNVADRFASTGTPCA
jgi:hypothetical protein